MRRVHALLPLLLVLSFTTTTIASDDYAVDPIRKTYKQRLPDSPIDLTQRTHFVAKGVVPTSENTKSVIRVRLLEGRRLVLENRRPIALRSIIEGEPEANLWRFEEDLLASAEWHAVVTQPEDRVVADWRVAEAFWGRRLLDPRTLYRVVVPEAELEDVAFALTQIPIVEHVDIASYSGPKCLERSDAAARIRSANDRTEATATPNWISVMEIDKVQNEMGIVGRKVIWVMASLGVPVGGSGFPPMNQLSAFGPFPATAQDNFEFAMGALAIPKATFGCVRVSQLNSTEIEDFQGGLGPLVGQPSPLIYESGWGLTFLTGFGPHNGKTVPLEWDLEAFQLIGILTGSGKTILEWAGGSGINLDDLSQYPNQPHFPFINDSGGIIVRDIVPPFNFGNAVDAVGPAADAQAAASISMSAALVESALQQAGQSVPGTTPRLNGGLANRALPLRNARDSVRFALARFFPNPTLRVQNDAPDHNVLVQGSTMALGDVPHLLTRIEGLRVYNDGNATMNVRASFQVLNGPDTTACVAKLSSGSISPFGGTNLQIEITPHKAGPSPTYMYQCRLNLDVNDPRLPNVVDTQLGLRRWSMDFTFRVPARPGAAMRVEDYVGNEIQSGHVFDFGRLEGTVEEKHQTKVIFVHNELWADRNLTLSIPSFPPTARFTFGTPFGLPPTAISIVPGDYKILALDVFQKLDAADRPEKTFTADITFTTNDNDHSSFTLKPKVTLRSQLGLVEFLSLPPRGYVQYRGGQVAEIGLGDVIVDEWGSQVVKVWGAVRAFLNGTKVKWKEYTGPLDSIQGLVDPSAKTTLGKIIPIEKIVSATEIIDFAVNVLVPPPEQGRFLIPVQMEVTPPGGTSADTYYVILSATIRFRSGPQKLGVVQRGFTQPQLVASTEATGVSADATESDAIPMGGTVSLGQVQRGSSVRREIALENLGNTPMTIRGLWVDGDAFATDLSSETIPPGTTVILGVTLNGFRRGPASARLSFFVDGTGDPNNFFMMNLAGSVCEGSNCANSTPVINSFTVTPGAVDPGKSATLSWNVTNSTSVSIQPGIGNVSASGTRSVTPTQTTDYVLTAVNGAETVSKTVRLTVVGVGPPGSPTIESFTATPQSINPGQSSTLSWSVTGATSLTLTPPGTTITGTSTTVSPAQNTTYVLAATNSSGTSTKSVTVTVGAGAGDPVINAFTADPANLSGPGQQTTLSWDVTNASTVDISPGIGSVPFSGTRVVSPSVTTQYTLRATNPAKTVVRTTTVTVAGTTNSGTPPNIATFTASSSSAAAGQPVTLTWSVENADLVVLAPPLTPVDPAGSRDVSSQATTTYTLFARNSAGSVSSDVTITVTGGPAVPQILEFTVVPQPVVIGGGGELRWTTSGASSVHIGPDIGAVAATGVKSIRPGIDTMYVLTATNAAGSVSKAVAVKTAPPPNEPLTRSLELMRGTDVTTGVRLEHGKKTNLYDPIRGYVAGSLPLLVINRTTSTVTIARAYVDNYWGGSKLFSLSSELKDITLAPDQSVPVTLRWNTPEAPRGYNGFFYVELKNGASTYHDFQIVTEWKQEGTSSQINLTDASDVAFTYDFPSAPFLFPPSGGLDLGLANAQTATATRLMRVHNKSGSAVTMIQAWCGGTDFSIRPTPTGTQFPVGIPAHDFATLRVTAVNQYRSGNDRCYVHTQSPGDAINEGSIAAFNVSASGLDTLPIPFVFDTDFHFVDDFSTDSNPKEVVLRLRPGRTATMTFTVENANNAGRNSDLHIVKEIQISGSGFRISRGYHAVSRTIEPLYTILGGLYDRAAFKVQFTGKPSGTYNGVVKLPMWGGSRSTAPYDWERTYEIHIKAIVGRGKVKLSQGDTELENGGGFDADEPATFTVENTSDGPVTLSNLAVPPHYAITSQLPHTLAAGQSGTFVLSPVKSAAGEGPHYVSFSVDDPDDPIFQVRENHKPIAVGDVALVDRGQFVAIDVTANDTDIDGDGVSVTFPLVSQPSKGTATFTADDMLVYTPNDDAVGNDRFTYEIDDGNGGTSRADVTISIAVTNRNPIAEPDFVQTKPGRAVTINVTGNDSDPDGDPVVLISDPIVVAPTNGTAVKVDKANITYTPNAGFNGTDTFTYEVGDTFGKRARAVVTIEVENTKPVAVDDVATTKPNLPVTINVTANDFDEDGDTVSLITDPIVEGPSFGVAIKESASSIKYTPNAGYAGTDVFIYEIGDGFGRRARAQVVVTVSNARPIANPDTATTKPGTAVIINVTANDSDPDGDPVVLITNPIVVQPTSGTATRIDNNRISYTPGASFTGVATFTYEVGDTYGSRARAEVTVTVSNAKPNAVADVANTKRNEAVTVNVTANDSDPDGDLIFLIADAIAVPPGHGTAVRVDDNKIKYTPNRSFVGTDTLTYEIGDGYSGRDRATLTITVVNSGPPAARNDHVVTKRDTPVTIDLLANDRDVDGQTITLTASPIKTAPRNGTVTVLSNTSVRYTPNSLWAGNDVFEYEIADASGNKDRAWVAVHVGRTKSLPVAVDDSASTLVNKNTTINVLANDSSPDGDAITLTPSPVIRKPLHGRVGRVSDSVLSFTPQADWTGTDTLAYEISDSEGQTAAAFVTITVTSDNRAPVASNDSASIGVNVSVTVDVTANDSDPDGDPITLIAAPIVVAPQYGSAIRVSASSIAYTPLNGYVGSDTFEYEISDGHGLTARAAVNITVANTNHPPEAFDDDAVTTAGVAVTIEVTANDSDVDGDRVALITNPIITAPAHGTAVKVSATSITYTPTSGYTGTDRFQYEIGDFNSGRSRAWVDITIGEGTPNRNPVAVDDEVTTKELTAIDVNVTANDSDPDGDTVVLIANPIIVAPAHGTAVKVNASTIKYTPASGFVGVDTLQYEVGDGKGKRSRAWVRVSVRDTNSRPVAVGDEASTTPGVTVTVNVTSNDSDPDGDVVRLITSPIITPPVSGTATKVDANSIKYAPNAGFQGADRFQYEIGDGRGGRHRAWVNITVSGNSSTTSVGFAAITTLAVGGVPPTAGNDATEAMTDTAIAVVVLANDLVVNGKRVILTANPVVTPPLFGTVQRTSDTTLTYTPSIDFRGNDRFEYEVVDTDGVTTTAWVTVQVPGDNAPPVAVNDVTSAPKDGSATINPLANDTDPDGDTVVLTLRAVTVLPQHGTVRRESELQLVYSPAAGFTGDDSFTYEITDRRGGTTEGTVVIHVIGGTQPPVAGNDSATVQSGKAIAVNVLANDRDPDNEAVTVTSSQPPQHGGVVWSEGTATYQSTTGYVGSDSFTYTISDPSGLTAQATVSITVVVANNATIVANDSAETKTRTPVLIGVLANDWDPDYGQKVTVASVTQPARGTVVISTNRLSVTYTPANDFAGTDTFQYTTSDGIGSATATVTVTVLNQAPLPRSEMLAAPEDTWVGYQSYHVLGNDTDPDGDELHIVKVEQPANGAFLVSPDSSQFSYKSKDNWCGIDSFYYTVGDPFGASVRVLSQIGVSCINDSPVANPDTFSVYKNQLLTITQAQVVANDTDIEGHTITVYSVGAATNGATQKLADGSITYQPYGEFVGTDSFEYIVDDSGGGAYGTGRITVNVLQDTRPVPNFTFSCTYLNCTFDASSSTDDRGIVSYQWNMGNNSAAAGKTFPYTYGAAGSYNVRLTVQDVLGQTEAISKVVTVAAPPNNPPTPRNDAFTRPEDMTIAFSNSELLVNDTDPEGQSLRITAVTLPANGTLTYPADFSTFTYRPNANWSGQDSFWYTVADTANATAQAYVQLNVTPINDSPVANPDTFSVYKNQLLTVTQAQVVANDTDVEGHAIYVYSVGPATNGTTEKLADGSIKYQPYNEFVGTDAFDYTVNDSGGGAYATGRITVNVLQDTKPVPNFTVTCTYLACSFDASASTDDRGIVSYSWTLGNGSPAAGKTFNYTYPNAGTYEVRLTVQDTLGQTAALSKWITVCQQLGIAAQPVSQTINAGYTASLSVTASGTGPFNYQWFEGTSGTTTTPVGTNSSTFTTPGLTVNKSYWVRVTSTCNSATVNSSTATVTVCAYPGIATHPASQTINYNTAATLTVTPSGSGPFNYQWYQGATGVTTTPVGTNSSSFTTPPLTLDRQYWVRVTSICNGSVPVNSNTATITVRGALARRQKAFAARESQTGLTANWTQPTQAGTLLVAVISANNNTWPIATFTPPPGWQHAVTHEWNNIKTSIYYYPNNPGGRTSETFTTGQFRDQILQLMEYEGVMTTNPLDKTATNGNNSPDSGYMHTGSTAVTAQSKEVVVTAMTMYSPVEFYSPTDSFVEVDDRQIGYWSNLTTAVHDRFTSAPGSYGHWAQTYGTAQWVAVVATFRASDTSNSTTQSDR